MRLKSDLLLVVGLTAGSFLDSRQVVSMVCSDRERINLKEKLALESYKFKGGSKGSLDMGDVGSTGAISWAVLNMLRSEGLRTGRRIGRSQAFELKCRSLELVLRGGRMGRSSSVLQNKER